MNIKEMMYFDPKIRLGLTYRISNFMCEPTDPYQQTIDNKTSIRFGRITRFDPITAPEIPHHYFKFVSYNQLQSKVPKEDITGRMQYPVLTGDALGLTFFCTPTKKIIYADTHIHFFADFIGYLKSVGQLNRKPAGNQGETIYRKVDIESLRYPNFQP